MAFQKPSAAHRVKEQSAGHTALGRAHKCFANLVNSTAFIADVKFQVAKTFGVIDVGNDLTQNRLGRINQFKRVSRHRRDAEGHLRQAIEGLGPRTQAGSFG